MSKIDSSFLVIEEGNRLKIWEFRKYSSSSGIIWINGYIFLLALKPLKTQHSTELAKSVESAIDLYSLAKATYLEVPLAQQNSLQAQLDVITVQKLKRIALVNLYRSLWRWLAIVNERK